MPIGNISGHRHWRVSHKGMVLFYTEAHSPVFLFRMLLSTRSDGEARPVSFNSEHPLFTVLTETRTSVTLHTL